MLVVAALAALLVRPGTAGTADDTAPTDAAAAPSAVADAGTARLVPEPVAAGPGDRMRALTRGEGADFYFDLVGTGETMLAGVRALGRAGCLVIIGYTGDDLVVSPVDLILSEIRIVTSLAAARHDLETAVRLAADGRLTVHVDTRYPLSEVATALERLRARQVHGRNVLVW